MSVCGSSLAHTIHASGRGHAGWTRRPSRASATVVSPALTAGVASSRRLPFADVADYISRRSGAGDSRTLRLHLDSAGPRSSTFAVPWC